DLRGGAQLFDHLEAAMALDDLRDGLVLVPGPDEEARRLLAHLLVLLERQLDALRARLVGALADDLRVVGAGALARRRDALVHAAEQRLRPADACLSLGQVRLPHGQRSSV